MKCVQCNQRKGKRECALHNDSRICGKCCAEIRTPEKCAECEHFKQAEKYQKERARQGKRPQFVMRVDEKVEAEIDQTLEQIQAGRNNSGAESRIQELYRENPDLACTQYAMGVRYVVKEKPDEALGYFREAVNTNPYFEEAYFNLSECYRENMELGNAIRTLQAAQEIAEYGGTIRAKIDEALQWYAEMTEKTEGVSLEAFLRSADAFDRGFSNMENGKWREAITDFEESLKHKPKTAQAYGNIGTCWGRLGEKERAREMLEKALEVDPSYEPAQWNLKALDKMAEGDDLAEFVSLAYGAERYQEEKEKQEGQITTEARDPEGEISASSALNFMRRQSEATDRDTTTR